MTLCAHCGVHGTNAPHGYCATVSTGCRWKQQSASRVLKTDRDEINSVIEDILSWDWVGHLDRTNTSNIAPPQAVVLQP